MVELDFGEQQDMRGIAFGLGSQATGRGGPAGVPAHHFEDEHLGRGAAHAVQVVAGLADRDRRVLGHTAETGRAVGVRQVIVHGLGDMDRLDRIAQGLGQLADLGAGVGRVAAAVVKEVADVVGLEHFDQAFVLRAVLFQASELVAGRPERSGRGVAQCRDGGLVLGRGIDQFLGERADNAVAARIDRADGVAVLASGLDHTGGRCVDHSRHTAALGIEGVLLGHPCLPL